MNVGKHKLQSFWLKIQIQLKEEKNKLRKKCFHGMAGYTKT